MDTAADRIHITEAQAGPTMRLVFDSKDVTRVRPSDHVKFAILSSMDSV
jgi:hypothetical protein